MHNIYNMTSVNVDETKKKDDDDVIILTKLYGGFVIVVITLPNYFSPFPNLRQS